MSTHAISCVLGNGSEVDRSLSDGYERLVLIAVAHRADDRGFAWPRIADLARQANVHRSTVNRNLDELISLGELRMFTRGHYRSPAYVMTIVDHPLSTTDIARRLGELDDRVEWHERVIDPASGDAVEVALPGQGSLDLGKRLSQSATISENHTAVSKTRPVEASDQGKHTDAGRENSRKPVDKKIVAERDNLGKIVAERDEIVAERDEIVAVARRSSEPTKNHHRTARAAPTFPQASFPQLVETELRSKARARARARDAYNVEGLASKILTEDRDLLAAELVESQTAAATLLAVDACRICDDHGFAWTDAVGHPVGHTSPSADVALRCDHLPRGGEPTLADSDSDSGFGPTGVCVGCGGPANITVAGQPGCLDCLNRALTPVAS